MQNTESTAADEDILMDDEVNECLDAAATERNSEPIET